MLEQARADSGHPERGTENEEVGVGEARADREEDDPEHDLATGRPAPEPLDLGLEPLPQTVGPLELAGPDGQPEQHQRDAAGTRQRAGHDTQTDQQEPGEADADPVDAQLVRVLPDPASPGPAVLVGFDQDVVVLVVLLRVGRAVRAIDRGLRIEPGGGVGGFGFGGRRGHRRRGDPVRGPASSVPRVPCAETGAATHIAAAPVLDAGRHGHNSKGTGQALGVAPITRRARSESARPSVTLVPQ